MVKIDLRYGVLFLDAAEEARILVGAHRSFFELAAGYKRDLGSKRYTLNDPSIIQEVLIDTIEYLKDEGIEFVIGNEARQEIERFNVEQKSYEAASVIGLEIKENPTGSLLEIPGLKRELKPYQIQSVRHLLMVSNGANFSVPGSGKTTIVYATFAVLQSQGIIDKLLVIGPLSSFMPWQEEYFVCFGKPPRAARLTGPKRDRGIKYDDSDTYDLYLCSYQTASNDISELIDLCHKHRVFLVLDESHNIKRFEGGVRAEAVLSLAKFAKRRAILTGTPVPNSYEDLWTQMTFLWPGKQMLGNREQYAARIENENELAKVKSAIKPFFIRISKSDLGLPRQHIQRIVVPMKPYQANIYRALSTRILSELNLAPDDQRKLREWRKAKMVRLLQAASNPTLLAKRSEEFDVPPLSGEGVSVLQLLEDYSRFEIPAKFSKVIDLVGKLTSAGNKVIVWTSFVLNIQMLQKEFPSMEPLVLYGGIPKDETENEQINREQQIKKFKASTEHKLLLANPAACAESISLHKICHHAVYVDRTFDCGRYLQSLDRIHRIGLEQNEEVFYYILQCANSIDETIDQRLVEKEMRMQALLEGKDIPVGTFDLADEDKFALANRSEEQADFEATVRDLQKQYGQSNPT